MQSKKFVALLCFSMTGLFGCGGGGSGEAGSDPIMALRSGEASLADALSDSSMEQDFSPVAGIYNASYFSGGDTPGFYAAFDQRGSEIETGVLVVSNAGVLYSLYLNNGCFSPSVSSQANDFLFGKQLSWDENTRQFTTLTPDENNVLPGAPVGWELHHSEDTISYVVLGSSITGGWSRIASGPGGFALDTDKETMTIAELSSQLCDKFL